MLNQKIGGGFVRLAFNDGIKRLPPGTQLSVEQIEAFANGRRLIRTGYIETYPPRPPSETERRIVHIGAGRYDVFEGVKLNDDPLTKDEAEALASPSN